jgi:hypothetical protein
MKNEVESMPYTKVQSGELAGSATAAQMPDIPCRRVMFIAMVANPTNVYIGGAGVTVPDASTDTTSGIPLDAGDATPWFPIDNLNRFYYIGDSADDELIYLALG